MRAVAKEEELGLLQEEVGGCWGDALQREESCGGHFREEHQTDEGEAKRDDENFSFVGAWEYKGVDSMPQLHKEELTYEEVKMTQRSYK